MRDQMRNFLDQSGGLWAKGASVGKVAGVFTSTDIGVGQEMTVASTSTTFTSHHDQHADRLQQWLAVGHPESRWWNSLRRQYTNGQQR